jgi:hypothetical protein
MLQSGRSRIRSPMKSLKFFNWLNPSSRNMVLLLTVRTSQETQGSTACYRDSFTLFILNCNCWNICEFENVLSCLHAARRKHVPEHQTLQKKNWELLSFHKFGINRSIEGTSSIFRVKTFDKERVRMGCRHGSSYHLNLALFLKNSVF